MKARTAMIVLAAPVVRMMKGITMTDHLNIRDMLKKRKTLKPDDVEYANRK